jgi:transposase-like protein
MNLICEECGQELSLRQRILGRSKTRFCSQSCAARHNNRERSRPLAKDLLDEMYLRRRMSMAEIAQDLGCSVNKVEYWMRQHNMQRRRWDEATYIKHNPAGDPFQIEELDSPEKRHLFDVVVGLYVGEGRKSNQVVTLANSDPQVIRIWLRFLREICHIQENKIYVYLNMFDDLDVQVTTSFWQQVTGLPRSQFFKPTVRPKRDGRYGDKSPHGTCTVGVSNKNLARLMTQWCQEALGSWPSC